MKARKAQRAGELEPLTDDQIVLDPQVFDQKPDVKK